MMTELFAQLAQPNRLRALALEPVLDWAADALNRVDAATIRATLLPLGYVSGCLLRYAYRSSIITGTCSASH